MELWIILLTGFLFNSISALGDLSVQYIGPSILSEGDSFTLSCVTPSRDTSWWVLNGSTVITDENFLGFELLERKLYSIYVEMLLRTVSAQLFHTGEYRCGGNSREFHFLRVVEYAEDLKSVVTEITPIKLKRDDGYRYPKRYYLEPNTNYEFICETEEKDAPVLWFKDMKQIDAFTAPNLELYDSSLYIHNAQLGDVGEYACRLDALYYSSKRDVVSRYLLTSPARIVEISDNQSVIRGRSMTLYCRAKGYPAPKITWFIGNLNAYLLKEKDLRLSVYSKRERTSNAYLTVRNMTNLDRGLYTCRAENGIALGDDKKYLEKSVRIYVRDNIIEPNEDEPGLGKILVPGESLILHCKTEECPYCSVVWFKEGEKLASKDNLLHINEFNNSLTIFAASENDTGVYECAVNRELLNVDLRATIHVLTCEDLLSNGLTIESICEMPFEESGSMLLSEHPKLSILVFVAHMWWQFLYYPC